MISIRLVCILNRVCRQLHLCFGIIICLSSPMSGALNHLLAPLDWGSVLVFGRLQWCAYAHTLQGKTQSILSLLADAKASMMIRKHMKLSSKCMGQGINPSSHPKGCVERTQYRTVYYIWMRWSHLDHQFTGLNMELQGVTKIIMGKTHVVRHI